MCRELDIEIEFVSLRFVKDIVQSRNEEWRVAASVAAPRRASKKTRKQRAQVH